ncbi:saccharopine dehydrogenase family protein [Antrihabitans cavernicola]|uniref:Enoyl-ACP reductase n=1 Tax=Antrihabitans cavernicola TaxID=2495913 RepID=A0A5A7SCI2_9NOCA|nr:saccharopine dehydrogenase NADP-binding domain-containing protein [Spelaeibacter cavernicola]KAA0022303.1 enoyl-ACP reductase [Spelaeibacter cavernicola]
MAAKREFDLVLYGATGFVGKLTAQYLVTAAPPKARIALAGRSLTKLTAVRDELGTAAADWALIVADAADQSDVDAMAKRTKVVVTTVGPYAKYGLPLVQACAYAGTHYADLTGETLFVRDCIDKFHNVALDSGARIVNSCGFDSVPSDLSAYLIYRKSLEDNTGELETTTLVATLKGGASGGTIDSARTQFEEIAADPAKGKIAGHPYSLTPDRDMEPKLGKQSDQALRRADTIDASLSGWVTTFVMASYNTRVVRRSNALLGWAYGKNFRYSEVMSAGKSTLAPVLAAGIAGGIAVGVVAGPLTSRGIGKKIVDRIVPKPGTGPSEAARNSGYFSMKTFSHTSSGAKYVATFAAKGDPGYAATSVLLGESGLALAFDDKRLGDVGVVTPAIAMGEPLADRLRAAGMTITVERG